MQILIVENKEKGLERAKEELYNRVDTKTILFLSGGKTPAPLYEMLAKEEIIHPAGLALIDERYGEGLHDNSNQKMIAQTGLLTYASRLSVPFYPILQPNKSAQQTADAYDETVRSLFFHFQKSIGILGIGADGHTAGIAPNRKDFINPLFDGSNKHLFAGSFTDEKGYFGKRITLTFAGLSLLDFILVIAFGEDKKNALKEAFTTGSLEEVPARFFLSSDIAKKTLLITDQKI